MSKSTSVSPATDELGDFCRAGPVLLRRRRHGEHDRALGRLGEEGSAPVELAGARNDCDPRYRSLTAAAACGLDLGREHRGPVVLGPHRGRRDQHRVGERPEDSEHRFVGRAAERAGHAVPGRAAVDAHDHVEANCRPIIVVRHVDVHRGRIGVLDRFGKQHPHRVPPGVRGYVPKVIGRCFGPEMKVDASHSVSPARRRSTSRVSSSRSSAWISCARDVRAEAEVRATAPERDVRRWVNERGRALPRSARTRRDRGWPSRST